MEMDVRTVIRTFDERWPLLHFVERFFFWIFILCTAAFVLWSLIFSLPIYFIFHLFGHPIGFLDSVLVWYYIYLGVLVFRGFRWVCRAVFRVFRWVYRKTRAVVSFFTELFADIREYRSLTREIEELKRS